MLLSWLKFAAPFRRWWRFLTPAVGLSCLLLAGCGRDRGPVGRERTEVRTIGLDQSEEVLVDLEMGAGEMRVHGGADQLMEGRFTYTRALLPKVSYNSDGVRGHLVVEGTASGRLGKGGYAWDLRFNDAKPLEFKVNCGAGESRLDLGDLTLRRVSVQMGVGQLTLDLRGMPRNNYSVSVEGGVGHAMIYLPQDAGIDARVEGGIGHILTRGLTKRDGRYVNDAYGRAKTTVTLDVEGGIGSIDLVAN